MKKLYILFALTFAFGCLSDQHFKTSKKAESATLPKPIAKPATGITDKGFTANWEEVEGAEGYVVYVYRRDVVPADGSYTIIDEDFAGITEGSLIEPAGGDEDYVDFSAYTSLPGWAGYAFPNWIPSMVAGKIYSPEIDLSHNDGKYKLILTTYSTDGDEILIESHGAGEVVKKTITTHVENGAQGRSVNEIEFDNGCDHLYFSVINVTAEPGAADYFDRIQVVQDLKKDDVIYTCVALNEAIDAETEWGEKVTSYKFNDVTTYDRDLKVCYYDVFASAYNFGYDENGKMTYNYVYSPYSDKIKVDLENKTSDISDDDNNQGGGNDDNVDPNAPQVVDGKLMLGQFDAQDDDKAAYDGFNMQNSPIIFGYNHSGSQTIYLPSQLANIKGKQITAMTFKCYAQAYYTYDYTSDMKIFLKEVDDEQFYYNPESEYYEWFDFDKTAPQAEKTFEIDFLEATVNGEDIDITFDLSENPFTYNGKTLLVTITNDSETCIDMGDLVRFYLVKGQKGDAYRTAVFASDHYDFFWDVDQNHRITATENEDRWMEAPAVEFAVKDTEYTAISSVTANRNSKAWYNLNGQKIDKPVKGIYNNNGRKVVIK